MAAKKKTKKGPPRTVITNAVLNECLEHVACGGTVRRFCIEKGIKSPRLVYERLLRDPDFSGQLARAREISCMVIEDEMQDIADSPVLIETIVDGKKVEVVHPDDVQHRKLQLWQREKRLIWNNRERYGQQKQIEHKGTIEHVALSDQERQIALKKLLGAPPTKQIEITVEKDT